MASIAVARAELCRLRRDIARIEGRFAAADRLVLDSAAAPSGGKAAASDAAVAGLRPRERRGRLSLGLARLDDALGGGLPLATLHEIRAGQSRDGGVAAGFVTALLARLAEAGGVPSIVWI